MPVGAGPRVSIVILNWNSWEDTIVCLDSVFRSTYPAYDVVLVDNGSRDGSVGRIRDFCQGLIAPRSKFGGASTYGKPITVKEYSARDFPRDSRPKTPMSCRELVILRNETNRGFDEGCNVGMEFALSSLSPDYVMLLNNDTYVLPDCLSRLVKTAERLPEIAMVGPKICYYQEPNIVWAAGGRIRLFTGRIGNKGNGRLSRDYEGIQYADYVTGCAVMVRREVLDDIGLLDTRYFIYYEDSDWGLQARRHGRVCAVDCSAVILHKSAQSPVGRGGLGYYYFPRNLVLFMSKNARWYHLPLFIMVFVARYSTLFLFNLATGNFNRCRNILHAVTDLVRRASGQNPRTVQL